MISRNRLELLCRYLHFANNADDRMEKSDKAWKIHPFFNALRQTVLKIQPDQYKRIDEISVAYKECNPGPKQQLVGGLLPALSLSLLHGRHDENCRMNAAASVCGQGYRKLSLVLQKDDVIHF